MAWDLAGNLLDIRDTGDPVERSSLLAHEADPEGEIARKPRKLEAYLQRAEPRVGQGVIGQYHTPAPYFVSYAFHLAKPYINKLKVIIPSLPLFK